jgi:hypothetical protein
MDYVAIGLAATALLLYLGAISYAIVQISKTRSLNHTEKWVWAIAVVAFPVVATLLWFLAGPHPFGLRISPRDRF